MTDTIAITESGKRPQKSVSEFYRDIAEIYIDLSARQEPLGAEFYAIWDANIDTLYES